MANTYTGYLANDNILWCKVVDIDDAVDTTATATAVITAADGSTVESGLTLSYSADRTRHEVVPDEDLWTDRAYYTATISVTGTQGEEGTLVVEFLARKRIA